VDLEHALQLPPVIGTERSGEAPVFLGRLVDREMRRLDLAVAFFLRCGHAQRAGHDEAGSRKNAENPVHRKIIPLSLWFPARPWHRPGGLSRPPCSSPAPPR